MRGLRARGLRMALLTNNVREWEPLWRAKLPVDEIFELVVDSAFVGMRKPDREIFDLTLERLGLPAEACLFVDDVDVNCDAARALGMRVVHFRSNEQAIPEIEAALTDGARPAVVMSPHRGCRAPHGVPAQCSARAGTRGDPAPRGGGRRARISWRSPPIPAVELEALGRELDAAALGEPGQHGVQRLVLRHPRLEGLLAPEARRDLQRLAPVLAQAREDVDQELLVGDGLAHLQRGVPGGQHREVLLVEVRHGLRIVGLELALGDLVDPRPNDLAQELAAGLATDRLSHDANRILWLDEAKGHVRSQCSGGGTSRTVGRGVDGKGLARNPGGIRARGAQGAGWTPGMLTRRRLTFRSPAPRWAR